MEENIEGGQDYHEREKQEHRQQLTYDKKYMKKKENKYFGRDCKLERGSKRKGKKEVKKIVVDIPQSTAIT